MLVEALKKTDNKQQLIGSTNLCVIEQVFCYFQTKNRCSNKELACFDITFKTTGSVNILRHAHFRFEVSKSSLLRDVHFKI